MSTPLLELPTDRPLVLLPVRVETAFCADQKRLKVRVYPDEIHLDTHVPQLLPDEILWGRRYLELHTDSPTESGRKAAWRQLAARFGPERAAWVVRSLEADPQQTAGRTASWTRAPYTYVLPDRWVVVGYVKNEETGEYGKAFAAQGNTIREPLETGPTPGATRRTDSQSLLGDDPMSWMLDFDKAVECGMALSIPVADGVLKNGLDRLVVLGAKTQLSESEKSAGVTLAAGSAGRLRHTLEAHHYTRGLSFVPQGSPTRNTSAAPSGYTSADPGFEVSYRTERGPRRSSSGDGTNGSVLAKALGLDAALFEHVRFAGEPKPQDPRVSDDLPDAGREQTDARQMNTALWPATWGYYFSQLMAGAFQNPDATVGRLRRHFIAYVRGRGPLPVLRVGRQPYSFLPVTSLSLWKTPAAAAQDSSGLSPQELDVLAALLFDLRKFWNASVSRVARVGAGDPADSQQRLLEALSADATSKGFAVRNVLGSQFVTYYWNFLGRYCGPQWWERQEELARGLFASLERLRQTRDAYGLPPLDALHPRLVNFLHVGGAFDLDAPTVDTGATSAAAPLSRNYVEWLRVAGHREIRKRNAFFKQGSVPLLYLLLRYATLREYAAAAFRLSPPADESERYEPEMVDINPEESRKTLTVWAQLEKVIADETAPPKTVGLYLDELLKASAGVTDARLPEFVEFRESLRWLKDRPAAVLEPLVSETIDLCSHRLDAWVTSLATCRLEGLAQEGGGLYLGGYGWVEDLRPAAPGAVRNDAGFIHAPSMTHAAAAAMLYSAHLSHGASEGHSAFAVDLSSRRTRHALWLLEGVRQGQPLGALLGYRFERSLHELRRDKYISVFRRLAPLSTDPEATGDGAAESVAANNVADGATLVDLWQKGQQTGWNEQTIPFGKPGSGLDDAAPPSAAFKDLNAQLAALDGHVDALGDLLVAESAYQTARGNTSRASAVLDALGRGDAPPPEIEVTRTPRTGTGITHRVLVPFGGATTAPAGWPAPDEHNGLQARALAEPDLNSWVGSLLGDPTRFVCGYEYVDPQSGAPLAEPADAYLSVLQLSPLDLLYATQGSDEALQSELERRLTYWLMLPEQRGGISAAARVRLTFSRGAAWNPAAGVATFAEMLEAVAAVRRVVNSSRALEPRDLTWPADASAAGLNLSELGQRVQGAMGRLDSAVAGLEAGLSALDDAVNAASVPGAVDASRLDEVRGGLLRLSFFGVRGAVPAPPAGDAARDCALLQAQARAVLSSARRRSEEARAVVFEPQDDDSESEPTERQWGSAEQQRDAYRAALRAVFGEDFLVLTRFAVSDAAGSLQSAFGHSLSLQGGDAFAGLTMFQRVGRVREASGRLGAALLYANALRPHPKLGFVVGQLPFDATSGGTQERWVGLTKEDAARSMPGGRLSLLALRDDALSKSPLPIDLGDLCGLLVDEWVEVVPNATETTGVAFQYNEPGGRPPQAVLLAVAPAGQSKWNLDTLAATVTETLDLAKLRMVDPEIVPDAGQFLPALFYAVNQGGDAVSVDFRRVAASNGSRRKGRR